MSEAEEPPKVLEPIMGKLDLTKRSETEGYTDRPDEESVSEIEKAFRRRTYDGEKSEQKAVRALAWMVEQYLSRHDTSELDNMCMGAGELAYEVLAEWGLLTIADGQYRSAEWTEAGRDLLERSDYNTR
jgi:hypothetical protein